MKIEKFILVWLVSFILLVVFDMIWFSFSMPTIYKPLFNDIQKKFVFRVWSGIVVWVLIALFIAIDQCWVVKKAPFDPRILGFIYGFIIYGVYNFTNYATLYKYNLKAVFTDTLWGSLNIGITTLIIHHFMFRS
jgi:uncharacterized membrane protein